MSKQYVDSMELDKANDEVTRLKGRNRKLRRELKALHRAHSLLINALKTMGKVGEGVLFGARYYAAFQKTAAELHDLEDKVGVRWANGKKTFPELEEFSRWKRLKENVIENPTPAWPLNIPLDTFGARNAAAAGYPYLPPSVTFTTGSKETPWVELPETVVGCDPGDETTFKGEFGQK